MSTRCSSSGTMLRLLRAGMSTIFILFGILLASPPQAVAETFLVDGRDATCSDDLTHKTKARFCTISAAARSAGPGDNVLVYPGPYQEVVTPPTSGAPGAPITFRASAPGVVLLGTLDLGDPEAWAASSGSAWKRYIKTSSSIQAVFVDDRQLRAASARSDLTVHSFYHDRQAKMLFVDIGGANPTIGHTVQFSATDYGFAIRAERSHIVIEGFEMRYQAHTGIRLFPGSTMITVRDNTIAHAGNYGISSEGNSDRIVIEGNDISSSGLMGIHLRNSRGVVVKNNIVHHNGFHGISLRKSHDNQVVGNTVHSNAGEPEGGAAGIDINVGSTRNKIAFNTAFANQDSGIQVYNGSKDNLVVRNVSHHNQDHGFDANHAIGTRYISNTAYGNRMDGFSIKGNSTGTILANNISAQNGMQSRRYQLYVDAPSADDLIADHDIFWKDTLGDFIRVGDRPYRAMSVFFFTTGLEEHGMEEDPRFENAEKGIFRIGLGPAVDSGDAGAEGFSSTDHAGQEPVDMSDVPDRGTGTPPFTDRGAFEHLGPKGKNPTHP